MVCLTDENLAGSLVLHLGVALQAKIRVALRQHLPIDRAVRFMTDRATFPQRLMFEYERACLIPMAVSAVLVHSSHGQSACRFEDVGAVGIMALHAVHPAFEDGMMLRQIELSSRVQVALKTGGGVFARIHDELAASAAAFDMFAPWPVAGFAATFTFEERSLDVHAAVRTGRKHPRDVRVAVVTGLVADISGSWNFGWCDNRFLECAA